MLYKHIFPFQFFLTSLPNTPLRKNPLRHIQYLLCTHSWQIEFTRVELEVFYYIVRSPFKYIFVVYCIYNIMCVVNANMVSNIFFSKALDDILFNYTINIIKFMFDF